MLVFTTTPPYSVTALAILKAVGENIADSVLRVPDRLVPARHFDFIGPDNVHTNLYLHGTVQSDAGFDIPQLVAGVFERGREFSGTPCKVELPGSTIDCLMFIWDTKTTAEVLHTRKKLRRFQGLIAAIGDEPALLYASKCFSDKARFL